VLFAGVFRALCGVEYPFFVLGEGKKGGKMICDFCGKSVTGLIALRVYTRQGIQVCDKCYNEIDTHRYKPYSKVMDKLAMVEVGYKINRKLATMPKSRWQVRG
jgi:ribosome-binding protein aMBF1 (putative translation factor)